MQASKPASELQTYRHKKEFNAKWQFKVIQSHICRSQWVEFKALSNYSAAHGSAGDTCKGDERFQWEMPFFGVCQLRDPLTDFQRNWHTSLCRGSHPHTQVLGSIGSKGACLRMREIVTNTRLFFLFFLRFNAHRYRSARWTDRRH